MKILDGSDINDDDSVKHHEELPQQYPPWTGEQQSDDEGGETYNQCGMVSQIQSVVIQILSTHYEYGKGIHTLHALVDSIQKDISVLKNGLKDTERSHDRLLDKFGMHRNLTHSKSLKSQAPILDNSLNEGGGIFRTVQNIEHVVLNVTQTTSDHTRQIARIEKRHKALRRTVTKVLSDMAKMHSTGGQDDVKEILQHFLEKQKDTNANLLTRMRRLEEHHVKHQRHNSHTTLLLQNDATVADAPDKNSMYNWLVKKA